MTVGVAVGAAVAVACAVGGEPRGAANRVAGNTATATVTATGARVELGGAVVTLPPGAAPEGTTLAVRAAPPPGGVAPAAFGDGTAGTAPGIAVDLDGRQPDRPLRITLPATRSYPVAAPGGSPDPDAPLPFLLTRPSGGGAPVLVPATHDPAAGTVSADVTHLSDFWEALATPRRFADQLLHALAGGTPCPDCHGRRTGSVRVLADDDQVWACVREDGDGVVVELTDNSPVAWRVTTTADAVPGRGTTGDLGGIVGVEVGGQLYRGRTDHPLVLPVGGEVSYRFPRGSLPATLVLAPDAGPTCCRREPWRWTSSRGGSARSRRSPIGRGWSSVSPTPARWRPRPHRERSPTRPPWSATCGC